MVENMTYKQVLMKITRDLNLEEKQKQPPKPTTTAPPQNSSTATVPKTWAMNKQGKMVEIQFTCPKCRFHIFSPKLTACPSCGLPKESVEAPNPSPTPQTSPLPPKCLKPGWAKEMEQRGGGAIVKMINVLYKMDEPANPAVIINPAMDVDATTEQQAGSFLDDSGTDAHLPQLQIELDKIT